MEHKSVYINKILCYLLLFLLLLNFIVIGDNFFDELSKDSLIEEGSGRYDKKINSRSLKNEIYGSSEIKRLLANPTIQNNVSVKIQLLRIDESLSSQRIEITFWLHEVYKFLLFGKKYIPQYDFINDEKDIFNQKFIIEDKDFPLSNVVIKNALFLRIHRNPMTNSFFMINKNGTLSIHTKMTIDIPCIHLTFSHSGVNPLQMLCANSIYELPNFANNQKTNDKAVCQMEIGSFIKNSPYFNISWDSDPILDGTVPCSNENWPRCLVDQIHTFKVKEQFLNEDFDQLIACFLLNIRRVYHHV
ncbi:Neurotransmitter-gated ion-channel ligand-binding domain-containing protein [Strongyloides ratti]|uniref:Neurotransmitter-gated ion-channel ligand-binding domain-containing protein n=1 Tax=Strongyloides ratti TaxID=34506 RepID=A0A090LLH9_STRRB|nr:Neurotransmitter-gated ion-channel ligand-binding domain-containing protein [Strongyloides ratti]CEF68400.1 Neurotransmitter-gated ion-channel ligand-binding domain-containing protein [Strongyloides ratti]